MTGIANLWNNKQGPSRNTHKKRNMKEEKDGKDGTEKTQKTKRKETNLDETGTIITNNARNITQRHAFFLFHVDVRGVKA